MSYDPLFDVAQKAVDETIGEGEYARLNENNPGVPAELRAKLKGQLRNCPFYGRHLYPSNSKIVMPPFLLLDQQGNQCALIVTAFSPCQMEIASQPVDWRACPVAREIRLERP